MATGSTKSINPRPTIFKTLARKTLILLALTVVIILVVQVSATLRERAANRAYPPVGQIVEVDGTPLHVLIQGSGPDLVLIHGASGNLRDFTLDFADRLSDRYRVIMLDRPGLGATARLPGYAGAWTASSESPQEQAIFLQKAADIVGVQTPIVMGHSYGGAVALAWALERPDETAGLVLVSAVSNPWPGNLGWLYTVNGSAAGGALVVPLITAFVPNSLVDSNLAAIFAPQDAPEGYANHIGPGLTLRRSSMRANAQQVNSLRPHIVDISQEYSALEMPVEIVHGTADTIVPMEIHSVPLSQQIVGAVLTKLEGIGHMPHHVVPDAVVDAIDRAATRAGLR
ncbi:alpha/beta hydrolase [Sulfitobacter sp. SK012]|uniref:alpha/beta fold hydrolase n=1 Tax=Sulfitobacter sp. SK012 TaxID=1389005 RepID=UPI000E0B176C|nr:alpha/beta hydrolase [Sulfitobacter sp. SK012]AXI46814.1 alpha/beta hydrolase [Sulfitobacter sp. SK012]